MQKACLIFDVLRHNLNVTVFDQQLNILFHSSTPKSSINAEDKMLENLSNLKAWVDSNFKIHKNSILYKIAAINFTSYVGGIVHLDKDNVPVVSSWKTDSTLSYQTRAFIKETFDKHKLSIEDTQITEFNFDTAALQLLDLKKNNPEVFAKIDKSVSIAQYLQSQFSGKFFHDCTIIGSHSSAWNFAKKAYLGWIEKEGLKSLMLPVVKPSEFTQKGDLAIGTGMYYKVAETLPFLACSKERFVLLSTGSWTVCINPFNHSKASSNDINSNCFNVISEKGERIKLARLFSGNEHSRQIAHLSAHFGLEPDHCLNIPYDEKIIRHLRKNIGQVVPDNTELGTKLDCPFMERNLNSFKTIEEAYHQFVMDLVAQQVASIKLTIEHRPIIQNIFVEGGLAKNDIFMELLSEAFHDKRVYKVGFEDTAAMGAALVIGSAWGAQKPNQELLQIELVE